MRRYVIHYSNHFNILWILGQILPISTKFLSGNVIFTWTPSNYSFYDVLIIRDTTADSWTRVFDTQYTVRDVLMYNSITINVKTYGSVADNRKTYNGTRFYISMTKLSACVVCLQVCLIVKLHLHNKAKYVLIFFNAVEKVAWIDIHFSNIVLDTNLTKVIILKPYVVYELQNSLKCIS